MYCSSPATSREVRPSIQWRLRSMTSVNSCETYRRLRGCRPDAAHAPVRKPPPHHTDTRTSPHRPARRYLYRCRAEGNYPPDRTTSPARRDTHDQPATGQPARAHTQPMTPWTAPGVPSGGEEPHSVTGNLLTSAHAAHSA